MKIAVVSGVFPGRSETFVVRHVLGLAQRGHDVTVISYGPAQGTIKEEINRIDSSGVKRLNLDFYYSSSKKKLSLLYFWRTICHSPKMIRYLFPSFPWARHEMFWAHSVWKTIKQLRPDIIHIHYGAKAGPILHLDPTLKNVVVSWHGYDANHTPYFRGKDMYMQLFGLPIEHTVGSSFMCSQLEELGAKTQHINIIPMGVDVNKFTYKERFIDYNAPLRIISVGRLDEMKGHKFLVQAVNELLVEGEKIELRIIGFGPLQEELESLIRETQPSSIYLLGPQLPEVIIAELHKSDLFCLTGVKEATGRVETQGVVFAEAQATGIPVIGSSVGGIGESLVHGQTGFLCSPGEIRDIKEAIRFFVKDREAVNQFGRKGRRLVESKFLEKNMLNSFESLYELTMSKQ